MNKLKFYKFAVIGLVLLNIAVLGFFMMKKGRHHNAKHGGLEPRKAAEILNLSDVQKEKFLVLAEQHRSQMDSLHSIKKEILRKYYSNISEEGKKADEDILNQVTRIEKERIGITSRHFEDIKLLLDEEQMDLFENFVARLVQNAPGPKHKSDRKN